MTEGPCDNTAIVAAADGAFCACGCQLEVAAAAGIDDVGDGGGVDSSSSSTWR